MPGRAKIANNDKTRLLEAHNNGDDYVQLARQLGIARNTACAIIRRVLTRGEPVSLARGDNRPCLIGDEMKQILLDTIEIHPTFTLLQLKSEIQSQLPHKPHVSPTTIARCLKRLEDAPHERNSNITKDRRHEYATWLMQTQVNFAISKLLIN